VTGKDNVDSEVKFKVVLQDCVTISPETSELILRGTVLLSKNGEEIKEGSFIFCPNQFFENERILFAHCLVNFNQFDSVPVRLLYTGNECLKIKKNTCLGFVELLENNVYHRSLVLEKKDKDLTTEDLINYHTNPKYNRSTEENALISKVIYKYSAVFSKNKMDIGKTDIVKHQIITTNDVPVSQPLRKVPLSLEPKIETLIENLKSNEIIRDSTSPWSSPIVAVQKPDGQVRMCVDYRKLNSLTERPIFPIPDANLLFDTLGESNYFSAIDFSQGYYQVGMDEKDIEKTAFTTKQGHFEFLRMPFGLSGAPATFQRMMHSILRGLNWKTCLIYLDDVLIFSKTLSEHNERLCEVLECIKNAGLKLSPMKCSFLLKEVSYLGHTISSSGIKTDKSKIDKIRNFAVPKYESELVSFLGFCGYYRKFIRNYADLVEPLESICSKKTNKSCIVWTERTLNCFQKLKDSLTTAPVLGFPIKNGKFVLDTDASDTACGAVLSQIQNGQEKVLAYASHKFTNAERKYCTTRKELLAVHKYVLQFKHYLWGQPFVVRTDHKSLIWFLNWRNPNTSQYCRWRTDLEPFQMTVEHRSGKSHTNADFLSRMNCEQCEIQHACPKPKTNVKIYTNNIEQRNVRKISLQQKYNFDQSIDSTLQLILQLMKEKKINEVYPKELNECCEDGSILWYFRNRLRIRGDALFFVTNENQYLFIPPKQKRKEIILELHKQLSHVGFEKLYERLKKFYFWPKMKFDAKSVTSSCKNCAFTKLNDFGATPLQPTLVSFPFQRIGIDIAGPLPTSNEGYRYILGVVDYFSKYPMLIPLRSIDSKTIAKCLFEKWICLFGCPYQIHSDGGPNISGNLIKQVCDKLGIVKTTSTPYHPKSNGLIERIFRIAKEALRAVLYNSSKNQWPDKLPAIEMTIRSVKQSTTLFTPFEVLFGNEIRDSNFVNFHVQNDSTRFGNADEYVLNLVKNLKSIHNCVKQNIEKKAKEMKEKQKFLRNELHINSFVMVKSPPGKVLPLAERFLGPYKIKKVLNNFSYELQDASGRIIRRHRDNIKPILIKESIQGNSFHSQFSSSNSVSKTSDQSNLNRNNEVCQRSKRIRQPVLRYGYNA